MRKIKFRAWNKEKNIMVYGHEDGSDDCWDGVCSSNVEIINDIFSSDIENETHEFMQYTGLKDINGTEIYEGDIVEYVNKGTKGIGKIVYGLYDNEHQTDLGYYIQWLNQEYWRNDLGYWKKKGIEVRGNIYENSELLEEKRL